MTGPISFDMTELIKLERSILDLPPKFKARAWIEVRAASFYAERLIKQAMPVKTGRARASWGHSVPPAFPDDGIWEEDKEFLEITQGSRVPYIEELNEGSSKQAPAGFIDAVEVKLEQMLEKAIDMVIDDTTRNI